MTVENRFVVKQYIQIDSIRRHRRQEESVCCRPAPRDNIVSETNRKIRPQH